MGLPSGEQHEVIDPCLEIFLELGEALFYLLLEVGS